ncbi:glycosyltransferase [Arthrobacter psychrolactophilus]
MIRSISVVIPTVGRASVEGAVLSALAQTDVLVEVLVVYNGQEDSFVLPIDDSRVRVLRSDPLLRGNGARQMGINNAMHDLVALLDDDDSWDENKLSSQLEFVDSMSVGSLWICGCGMKIVGSEFAGEEVAREILAPLTFPSQPVDISNYLFRRDSFRRSNRQLQSSTLLFPRILAEKIPFDSSRLMHQDWAWLLQVEDEFGIDTVVCPEYLVTYQRNTPGAVSASSKWQQSMDWALKSLRPKSRRIFGDFVLTVPFNIALEGHDIRSAAYLFYVALVSGRPGRHAVVRGGVAFAREFFMPWSR